MPRMQNLIPLALAAHRITNRAALVLCRVMGVDHRPLLASPDVGVRIGACWLLPYDRDVVDIVGRTDDVDSVVGLLQDCHDAGDRACT